MKKRLNAAATELGIQFLAHPMEHDLCAVQDSQGEWLLALFRYDRDWKLCLGHWRHNPDPFYWVGAFKENGEPNLWYTLIDENVKEQLAKAIRLRVNPPLSVVKDEPE